MGRTPDAIVELWVRTLAKHGIDSLWIFDCLFNLDQMRSRRAASPGTPA